MRHPDEGEIHAWLDGALDPAMVAGLEAHVAACPDCAAAVAEARGLIAGASRILLSLDGVPGGVIPVPSTQAVGREGLDSTERHPQRDSKASTRRHTPWYAGRVVRIAAGLMLVAGVGGIVARTSGSGDQVSVQFETDGARAVAAPVAVDLTTGAPPLADAAGLEKSAAAVEPPRTAAPAPAALPTTPSPRPAANQPLRRADDGEIGAPRGIGAVGSAVGGVAGGAGAVADGFDPGRQRAKVAAAEIVSPPPPAAAPLILSSPLARVPQAAAQSGRQLDSLLNSLAIARQEPEQLRQNLAPPSGTLAGKVTTADGSPLQSASVVVATAAVTTQTAADGSFTLPPLPPGRYTVEARRIGYEPAKIADIELMSGETAFANLALKPASLQLSDVVVTGAADAAKRERLGFAAARSVDVSGACFVLDIDAGADVDGLMLLPRRIRIRMTDASVRSQLATGDIAIVKGAASASAYGSRAAPAATVAEPASPLPWQSVGADSIAATWTTESDVVTFRLRIDGSDVRGTAVSSRGGRARTSKISGRKVSCGGQ